MNRLNKDRLKMPEKERIKFLGVSFESANTKKDQNE